MKVMINCWNYAFFYNVNLILVISMELSDQVEVSYLYTWKLIQCIMHLQALQLMLILNLKNIGGWEVLALTYM